MAVRIGLVAYGTGGRYFRAPLIEAADGQVVAVEGRISRPR